MNPCVFTGAEIYLDDYNALVKADVFQIQDAVAIYTDVPWKHNPSSWERSQSTHTLTLSPFGHVSRDKKFMFVPASYLKGPRR